MNPGYHNDNCKCHLCTDSIAPSTPRTLSVTYASSNAEYSEELSNEEVSECKLLHANYDYSQDEYAGNVGFYSNTLGKPPLDENDTFHHERIHILSTGTKVYHYYTSVYD